MKPEELSPADALIVVDFQNDFCPGGALAVQSCEQALPVLSAWIDGATRSGAFIAASRDWHPPRHVSFKSEGGPWPAHCVQGTAGAEFHPGLKLPDQAEIFSKGTDRHRDAYSAFDGTQLGERLRQQGIERVWIGGLALDVCVRATAFDALREGFETHVIRQATSPVEPEGGARALRELRNAGAIVEEE